MKEDHFSSREAALAYARGRPYVHDKVVGRVRDFLRIGAPLRRALDVGCGTGLSAVALKTVSERVFALDLSMDMLALAPQGQEIGYLCASAEALPFSRATFDFVSVSSAYHWFDKRGFAGELARVLCPGGWAVIYETHFSGRLEGCPGFEKWFRECFRKRYWAPPRDYTFIQEDFRRQGVEYIGKESFEYTLPFTCEAFVNHLLSMTNITWAVKNGRETYAGAASWLREGLDQFDVLRREDRSEARGDFRFVCSIIYLKIPR